MQQESTGGDTAARIQVAALAALCRSRQSAVVPLARIRRLGRGGDRITLARHLLALPYADRAARCGGATDGSTILAQCAELDLLRDIGVGAFDPAGAMVGAAIGMVRSRDHLEIAVSVLPGLRRRGLGATLLARVCAAALDRGMTIALFEIAEQHRAMRALLEGLGAEPAGEERVALLPLARQG